MPERHLGDRILLGHGSGGKLYRDLVKDVFVNPELFHREFHRVLPSNGKETLERVMLH